MGCGCKERREALTKWIKSFKTKEEAEDYALISQLQKGSEAREEDRD